MKFKNICMLALMGIGMTFTAMAQNPHAAAHKKLIAKQSTPAQQVTLKKNAEFIDFSRDEEAPEIDIYTGGWNSAKFKRMHKGVDIGIRMNDTIYAAFDGKVRLTNYEARGYGNYVIMRHSNGLETVYGHLNKFLVKQDQTVRAGQPIALGGSTGRSTGPHLHFETRYKAYAFNPQAIVDITNKRTHGNTYAFSKSTYTQSYSGRTYASASPTDTYTVKKGDTLTRIAQINGISTRQLQRLNGLDNDDAIHVGRVLKVK